MESSLSHIALLVPAVEISAQLLNTFNIETEKPETFDSEGTKEIYVGSYEKQKGLLLLLEAISEGAYKRALNKRGPSLHHIAIDVLDVQNFIHYAQSLGWKLHPSSEQTMEYDTAWFYLKGIPTLIEVHQKRELSSRPSKVSKVEIPLQEEQLSMFQGIGLGDVVFSNEEIYFTIEGHRLSFAQIACINSCSGTE